MTLKTLLGATAIVALSSGMAYAECRDDLSQFAERYTERENVNRTMDRVYRSTLRDLRSAASRMAATGNNEACQSIVGVMHEIADDETAAMERAAEERAAATDDEPTASEEAEKMAKDAVEGAKDVADDVADRTEELAREIEARVVAFTESNSLINSSDLIGYNVYNYKDEFLGEIDGMLTRAGSAPTHLIVGHGGFLNIGDREAAIPVDKMKWDPKYEVFYVDISEEALDNAPDYDMVDGKWKVDANDAYYNSLDKDARLETGDSTVAETKADE